MTDDKDTRMNLTPKGPITPHVPEGDDRERMMCLDCGFVHYDNPRIVAGAVCTWEDKILLCRRAIEPRVGFWTILLGMFEIPRISQIYVVYHARMYSAALDPGLESLEAALFAWEDIPWTELAFPSVTWALQHHRDGGAPHFDVFHKE